MDALEKELEGQLKVIRLNIQDPIGRELTAVYGFNFTPTFILIDGGGNRNRPAGGNPRPAKGARRAQMNLFQRLRFNFWYFGNPPWDTGVSPPELYEFIDTHRPARAIDLGCGTGTNVITLAKAAESVTGVDFASRAIALARRKARAAHIQGKLRVGDATRLDGIEGPFDLALDMGCFHNIGERAAYLRELDRLLAPGGFWLMYQFVQAAPSLDEPGHRSGWAKMTWS